MRAQALDLNGNFVDDFHFVYTEGVLHVSNVPSPAATASVAIARHIVDMVVEHAEREHVDGLRALKLPHQVGGVTH